MPKLLKIWRVAEILDCTKQHVYHMIRDGEIVAVKLGLRGIRITQESVSNYLQKNQIDPEDYFK